MGKALYIAEKPSVAQEFARALKIDAQRKDGYLESADTVITWCVGHLVTMSYPEQYDLKYKKWSFDTLPFLPEEFKYEVIPGVKKQFEIVSRLLNRADIEVIYVCTDSGREGEYIYRLVAQMAGLKDKKQKRVWIDSQTEEEILRGIREAKDLSEYDNLSASAYLRAQEDYLMGINFSRALTLRYGNCVSNYLRSGYQVIAVGRVMTCVLGMVVRREREIRSFVKMPFYKVFHRVELEGESFEGEWRAVEGSSYFQSPCLYKENGFKKKEDAQELIDRLSLQEPLQCIVEKIERKKENKYAPLLFNLAELQNVCSKLFKISPDETLRIAQELYEKKLITYPRTDARVLSKAVAREIHKNLSGLCSYTETSREAAEILHMESCRTISKTRYVNDKQITDHYAIIPTGQGMAALSSLSLISQHVYETIVRRFLCIFYPPAVYQKVNVVTKITNESFFSSFKVLLEEGYLKAAVCSFVKKKSSELNKMEVSGKEEEQEAICGENILEVLKQVKKGDVLPVKALEIRAGETSPPKRYNSGSMVLAMENAGQLIEDEELRAQIKGSGIGTSATRAEILKKLFHIKYLGLNKKTQMITPTLLGEMIFDVVNCSIRQLLNPDLTASWEKGLTYVAEGSITPEEYMEKLEHFVRVRTHQIAAGYDPYLLRKLFDTVAQSYPKTEDKGTKVSAKTKTSAGKKISAAKKVCVKSKTSTEQKVSENAF